MIANDPYVELERRFARLSAVGRASAILNWDRSTMMPDGASDDRADQLATLGVIAHEMSHIANLDTRYMTIVGVTVGLIALIAGIKGPEVSDYAACTYHHAREEFQGHLIFVSAIFVVFIVIDVLTWHGMSVAAKAMSGAEQIKARSASRFALGQIWLVDIPVLFGGWLSYFLMNLPQQVNPTILKMDPEMFRLGERAAFCKNSGDWVPLSGDGFAEMITNLFLSGMSSGYLAAHVVMSQLVFVVLSVLIARELKKQLEEYRKTHAATSQAGA